MVLSFCFNSRILQTGILQTGPDLKQNQDNTGPRQYGTFRHEKFAETSRVFLCQNVLFPTWLLIDDEDR